jgi:hypothetical protein
LIANGEAIETVQSSQLEPVTRVVPGTIAPVPAAIP